MSAPLQEYSRRLEARRKIRAGRERLHIRLGNLKLATLVCGLFLAWFCFSRYALSFLWLAVPLALYLLLAICHELVLRARSRAERAAAFYEKGMARIEDRWQGMGRAGERFHDAKHVYAEDIDLFGRGSLFELLSRARTSMGEGVLAGWLMAPSPPESIRERHESLAELRGKLDVREDVALLGEDVSPRLDAGEFAGWAAKRPLLPGSFWRAVAALLAVWAVLTVAIWVHSGIYWPFLAALIANLGMYRGLNKRAEAALTATGANAEGVELFSLLLGRMERENFASGRLRGLQAELHGEAGPASAALSRLARIVHLMDARESLAGRLMELPLLYTIQIAFAAEAWKQRWGRRVQAWQGVVGEMEALLSLAAYSYEHPEDPLPEFAAAQGGEPLFAGEELGHPLIPASRCVRNSVRLDGKTRVLLVSGSNMSGKSTLLRTVGINAVLAMAGAPIRGKGLRMVPLTLGTRLRSTDSLEEGRSGFYTEILRIRQVFELTRLGSPLLFLFDELLEGTNSHDRQIGAEGLVRALVKSGAIGIVTTHDLALTEICAALDGAVHNMHFEDRIEREEMHFDYKLREGVVTRSNALELMRRMGLAV